MSNISKSINNSISLSLIGMEIATREIKSGYLCEIGLHIWEGKGWWPTVFQYRPFNII